MARPGDGLKHELTTNPQLRSALGYTRNGEPLSNNRAPAPNLSPWVARVYATSVEVEDESCIDCGMIADTPVLRLLFKGDWYASSLDGRHSYGPSALLFGPQTKRMKVGVRGSFATASVALKPGAVHALKGPKVADILDRILLYDDIYGHDAWGTSDQLLRWFDPAGSPEHWLRIIENLMRQLIEQTGAQPLDPVIEAFDREVFADPNLSIGDFVRDHDIERRRFERLIKRAYGESATQVLRRARALDIAAHLRGVADDAEAEEAALKFFDQSHMIREFKAFFDMTPRQFAITPQPFMTLTLEARQSRRLEVLGRAMPGEVPPWRAGD